jgi:hypothetical protein
MGEALTFVAQLGYSWASTNRAFADDRQSGGAPASSTGLRDQQRSSALLESGAEHPLHDLVIVNF